MNVVRLYWVFALGRGSGTCASMLGEMSRRRRGNMQTDVLPRVRSGDDERGSGQHIARAKLFPPVRPLWGGGGVCRFPPNAHQPACGTIPSPPQSQTASLQKKKRTHRIEREITPLAAAPATERSERVGEEAEESRKPH